MAAYTGEYEDVLRPFFDSMRYKLSTNKHKGRKWTDDTIEALLDRLQEEVAELKEAVPRGNMIEILLESADIANFAMMIASLAIKQASNGTGSDPMLPTLETFDPKTHEKFLDDAIATAKKELEPKVTPSGYIAHQFRDGHIVEWGGADWVVTETDGEYLIISRGGSRSKVRVHYSGLEFATTANHGNPFKPGDWVTLNDEPDVLRVINHVSKHMIGFDKPGEGTSWFAYTNATLHPGSPV